MMRWSFLFCLLISLHSRAQNISTGTLQAPTDFANIHVQQIAGDSLSTSFIIWIKQEVKSHKHEWHSETILVLEGEGTMRLGDTSFAIKPGDYVFIPKQTYHSVTVTKGILKVLSVQSPHFDGSDRIWESQ
jgi:quercetin dioxygenase-like cupin family protein